MYKVLIRYLYLQNIRITHKKFKFPIYELKTIIFSWTAFQSLSSFDNVVLCFRISVKKT